ncbi:hypothetical protein F5Y08DRAFT_348469 [Xylaria arbuscula]|nr:hypothetical protein F5Y08DRAFT_348469 [Xylaria arbuscula]
MAGLIPRNSDPIGRMVVDLTSTGQYIVHMAAAAPDRCGCDDVFEITVKQKTLNNPDSICITPSGSLPPPSVDQQSRPAGLPIAQDIGGQPSWLTTSWPMDPPDESHGSPYQVPVKENPVAPEESCSTEVSYSTHTEYLKQIISSLSTPSPFVSNATATTSASSFSTTTTASSSSMSTTTRPSDPTLSVITKVVTTSPLPSPPPSRPQQPSPSQTPTTFPTRPMPSAPAPLAPEICNTTYTSIDISELKDLDPGYFSRYLDMLGLGHLLDDIMEEVTGLLGNLRGKGAKGKIGPFGGKNAAEKKKLVHEFRVRCDVAMPEGPQPVWPQWEEDRHETKDGGGERRCLETCERQVIKMAGMGLLQECIGVAYREKPGAKSGVGECRTWRADEERHDFLPVDELPSAPGKGRPRDDGGWQVIYM